MKIEEIKEVEFPIATMENWVALVQESLKGKSFESLSKNTYENICLKPLYSKADTPSGLSEYSGTADFRRGINANGYYAKSWQVANKLSYNTSGELEGKLNASYSTGQTAIAFEVKSELFSDASSLERLLNKCSPSVPFSIDAKEFQNRLLGALTHAVKDNGDHVSGFIASDPVANAAENGGFTQKETEFFTNWEQTIKSADKALPQLKTILVNTSTYHNGGANAVQELGIALATGVFYVQQLLESGWDLEKATDKLIFHFSIGANFFMEIAKLRAARILWDKAMEIYGANEGYRKMSISAETSRFTKTIFDPYVNLLRAGNEAFSAVLGGIQYLSVSTLDEAMDETSTLSERIARNTQLILKSETHIEKVIDPAGGSWYIESLTKELAERAWNYFLELEDQGGIVEALKTNWLQNSIIEVRSKRDADVFKGKQSIIGTNAYANVTEKAQSRKGILETRPVSTFKPIQLIRLSEPYEKLRFFSLDIEARTGVKPAIGLIGIGDLKRHKPRADFVTSFLAAGGIETKKSVKVIDSKGAIDFIQSTGLKFFCLCGDNRQYNEIVLDLVKEITAKFPNVKLVMAGLPDDSVREAYSEAGIEKFIHIKSNQQEILSDLLQEMEVPTDEKEA